MARKISGGPTKAEKELLATLMKTGREQIEQRLAEAAPVYQEAEQRINLEAEAVLFFIENLGRTNHFNAVVCHWCGDVFRTTYIGVGYCREVCRKAALEAVGLVWNPEGRTDAERWGNRIRKVIGSEANERLDQWLEVNPKVRLTTFADAEAKEITEDTDRAQVVIKEETIEEKLARLSLQNTLREARSDSPRNTSDSSGDQ